MANRYRRPRVLCRARSESLTWGREISPWMLTRRAWWPSRSERCVPGSKSTCVVAGAGVRIWVCVLVGRRGLCCVSRTNGGEDGMWWWWGWDVDLRLKITLTQSSHTVTHPAMTLLLPRTQQQRRPLVSQYNNFSLATPPDPMATPPSQQAPTVYEKYESLLFSADSQSQQTPDVACSQPRGTPMDSSQGTLTLIC